MCVFFSIPTLLIVQFRTCVNITRSTLKVKSQTMHVCLLFDPYLVNSRILNVCDVECSTFKVEFQTIHVCLLFYPYCVNSTISNMCEYQMFNVESKMSNDACVPSFLSLLG